MSRIVRGLACCDALFDRYLWYILYVVSDVLNAFITTISIPMLPPCKKRRELVGTC